jgi:glyoxylase-like metal-dependent hydrolase (beta-lactamase superfamily II)
MRELAEGVWQVTGLVPHLINAYLIRTPAGEVLIDACTRWATRHILRQLHGRQLTLVALTHVHPDHQGAAAEVCQRFGVPLACHEADADVMEGKQPMAPDNALVRLGHRLLSGPAYPVEVRYQGGELLGDWRVIHAPGHTPGHVIYFRERDRTAIVGDVIRNASLRGGLGDLNETPHIFSVDPLQNRLSMRLLADLQPLLLCFGHGPPLRNSGEMEHLVDQMEATILALGPG